MKNLVLLSSIIVCTYQQNLPFYWRGKVSTTFNGTMQGRIPIRIRGNVITYISLDLNSTESDPNIEKTQNLSLNTSFVIIPDSQVLPSNEAPTGIPGTVRFLMLCDLSGALVLKNRYFSTVLENAHDGVQLYKISEYFICKYFIEFDKHFFTNFSICFRAVVIANNTEWLLLDLVHFAIFSPRL